MDGNASPVASSLPPRSRIHRISIRNIVGQFKCLLTASGIRLDSLRPVTAGCRGIIESISCEFFHSFPRAAQRRRCRNLFAVWPTLPETVAERCEKNLQVRFSDVTTSVDPKAGRYISQDIHPSHKPSETSRPPTGAQSRTLQVQRNREPYAYGHELTTHCHHHSRSIAEASAARKSTTHTRSSHIPLSILLVFYRIDICGHPRSRETAPHGRYTSQRKSTR